MTDNKPWRPMTRGEREALNLSIALIGIGHMTVAEFAEEIALHPEDDARLILPDGRPLDVGIVERLRDPEYRRAWDAYNEAALDLEVAALRFGTYSEQDEEDADIRASEPEGYRLSA